jgi:hypothetical protein
MIASVVDRVCVFDGCVGEGWMGRLTEDARCARD